MLFPTEAAPQTRESSNKPFPPPPDRPVPRDGPVPPCGDKPDGPKPPPPPAAVASVSGDWRAEADARTQAGTLERRDQRLAQEGASPCAHGRARQPCAHQQGRTAIPEVR